MCLTVLFPVTMNHPFFVNFWTSSCDKLPSDTASHGTLTTTKFVVCNLHYLCCVKVVRKVANNFNFTVPGAMYLKKYNDNLKTILISEMNFEATTKYSIQLQLSDQY